MQLTVFVRELVLPCRIGVLAHEQDIAQPVRFTVEATLNTTHIPETLPQTLCYASIAEYIRTLSQTHTPLAETLANKIADFCLDNTLCSHVKVIVEKMAILPEAAGAGVVLVKKKS